MLQNSHSVRTHIILRPRSPKIPTAISPNSFKPFETLAQVLSRKAMVGRKVILCRILMLCMDIEDAYAGGRTRELQKTKFFVHYSPSLAPTTPMSFKHHDYDD